MYYIYIYLCMCLYLYLVYKVKHLAFYLSCNNTNLHSYLAINNILNKRLV